MSTCNTRRAGQRGTSWFWACTSPSPPFPASLTLGALTRYTTLLAERQVCSNMGQGGHSNRIAFGISGLGFHRLGQYDAVPRRGTRSRRQPHQGIRAVRSPAAPVCHLRSEPSGQRLRSHPARSLGRQCRPQRSPQGRLHPNGLIANDIQQPTTATDGPQGYPGRLTLPSHTTKFPDHSKESA